MDELTFQDVFEDVCTGVKEGSQVEILSRNFSLLKTDEQRYAFVAPFLSDFNFKTIKVEGVKSELNSTSLREQGNKQFGKKLDLNALSSYSESIAQAPQNSQALTLAFANRSAVLKSLGLYEECIQDIDRAFQNEYPENLKYKLLTRKAECYMSIGLNKKSLESFVLAKELLKVSDLTTEKLKECEKNLSIKIKQCQTLNDENSISNCPMEIPEKSYGQNSEVMCASDCIAIKHNDDMGRHVVATRDITPGDVLIVEKPYAAVLLPEFVHSHCSYCLKRCSALLPCPYCTLAMFCSDECCESSWTQYHHLECAAMSSILELDMGKMALLAVRIVTVAGIDFLSNFLKNTSEDLVLENSEAKRTVGYNSEGKYNSLDFEPIYRLITNSSLRSVPDLFKRSLMAGCLLKCLNLHELPDSDLFGGLLLKLLQSLPCNAHEVSELCKEPNAKVAHSVEIGAAAYATLSLLNHSCDPNVVRHSYGTTAVLRAIRSVPQGHQVLDNYGFHFAVHTKSARQAHLKSQYLFNCLCEACIGSWPLHKKLPIAAPIQDSVDHETLREAFRNVMDGNLTDDELKQLFTYLQYLDKFGGRLCQEYNCCQEAIKQHFAKSGNYYQVPNS